MGLLIFALVFLLPLALASAAHFSADRIVDWRNADRSSAELLPPAAQAPLSCGSFLHVPSGGAASSPLTAGSS